MIITIVIYRCKAIRKLTYIYTTRVVVEASSTKSQNRKEEKERDRDEIGGTKWLFYIIITTTFKGKFLCYKTQRRQYQFHHGVHPSKDFQRCRNMVRVYESNRALVTRSPTLVIRNQLGHQIVFVFSPFFSPPKMLYRACVKQCRRYFLVELLLLPPP